MVDIPDGGAQHRQGILGFTGPPAGMTEAQFAALPGVLATLPAALIHGGAIGADERLHGYLAPLIVADGGRITILAVGSESYSYWYHARGLAPKQIAVEEWSEPLRRNLEMIGRCHRLLATPSTFRPFSRSGTWTTIRYARKARRPTTLILPDGTVTEENFGWLL